MLKKKKYALSFQCNAGCFMPLALTMAWPFHLMQVITQMHFTIRPEFDVIVRDCVITKTMTK